MAQVDVKWPSEDEEFDAKVDGVEPTKVAVTDQNETEEAVPVEAEATATEVTQENNGSEDIETPQETSDTDQGEPETAPEVQSETESTSEVEPTEPTPEEPAVEEPTTEEAAPESETTPEETTTEESQADVTPEEPVAEPEAVTPTEETASEPEAEPAPEPGSSIAPEATSEPTAVSEAAVVADTTPAEEKPPQAPTAVGSTHHYGRDILVFVLVLAIAGLGLWSWTLYTDKQNLQKQLTTIKTDPQAEISRQAKALVATVGKLTTLPTTEDPTIQTVTDAKLAKQQADFYAKAENGDKVLLYVNSRQAILYRPSTNKVISVSPIQLDGSQASTNTTNSNTKASTRNTN